MNDHIRSVRPPGRALGCVAITVLGLALAAPKAAVATAPPPSEPPTTAPTGPTALELTAEWPLLEADETAKELRGTSPSAALRFAIPPGMRVAPGATLDIDYRAPALITESALALTLNDDTVDVQALVPGANRMTFAIPPTGFVTGENVLEIDVSLALTTDGDCPDPNNVARQISILGGTTLRVPLVGDAELSVAGGAEALLAPGREPAPLTVVLGDAGDQAMMGAASTVVGTLRDIGGDQFPIELGASEETATAGPTLIVGVDPELTEPRLGIDRNASGWPRLAVAAPSSDQLADAVLAFADPLARAAYEGADTAAGAPLTAAEPPAAERRFDLAALGYDDRSFDGPRESGVIYQFDLPVAERPAGIALHVRAALHAEADRRDIALVVELNSTAVGTLSFDEATAQLDDELTIPATAVRSGTNFLRMYADFGTRSVGCGRIVSAAQSITVGADTTIELGVVDGLNRIDLDDLPYTFRADVDSASLAIVLPTATEAAERLAAIELAALLTDSEHVAKIVTPEVAIEQGLHDGTHHLVLLGTAGRQPLLDRLPLPLLPQGGTWVADTGSSRPAVDVDGAVQVYRNPNVPARAVLAVTGLTDAGALAAANAVLDQESRGSMRGRATLVATDGASTVPVIVAQTDPEPEATPAATSTTPDAEDASAIAPTELTSSESSADAGSQPDSTSESASTTDDQAKDSEAGGSGLSDLFPAWLIVGVLAALAALGLGGWAFLRRRG